MKYSIQDSKETLISHIIGLEAKLAEAEKAYEAWKSKCLLWNSKHDAIDKKLKVAVEALDEIAGTNKYFEDAAEIIIFQAGDALDKIKGEP